MTKSHLYITEPSKSIGYYLDLEGLLLRHSERSEESQSILMLWSVGPMVIYGRNQQVEAEVNLEYCQENGIEVYQRHSGGGAVYADEGNLMVSWITPCESVEKTFGEFLERFSAALRSCGIDCSVSGRNDICVGDRKISGNAFYKAGNYAVVHGTLLWDVNLSTLENAITPSAEKLASKGIKSVRSRVVNLRELYSDLSLDTIREAVIHEFC